MILRVLRKPLFSPDPPTGPVTPFGQPLERFDISELLHDGAVFLSQNWIFFLAKRIFLGFEFFFSQNENPLKTLTARHTPVKPKNPVFLGGKGGGGGNGSPRPAKGEGTPT